MILYFSGTGNSEYLAKELGKALSDEVVDLFSYINKEKNETFSSDRPFVLVSPTYSWRVPIFLTEYLRTCTFNGNKNFYLAINYGILVAMPINT